MKDFLGNDLQIGDMVVFMLANHRTLMQGNIASLGKKKATIFYDNERYPLRNRTIQFYERIIKIK